MITPRPAYSAGALARRLAMSKQFSLFAIVEGDRNDVPFYEKVLEGYSPELAARSLIWRGSQVGRERKGREITVAGGKPALIKLHDFYSRQGLLAQSSDTGYKKIVFFLDKDHDDVSGKKKRSAHVIYTEHADVEAEIWANGNMVETARIMWSLSREEAASFSTMLGPSVLTTLADRWTDWIRMCVVADWLGIHGGLKSSIPSQVNAGYYGQVDAAARSVAMRRLTMMANRSNPPLIWRDSWIDRRYQALARRGEHKALVKGRLVPGFVDHEAQRILGIVGTHARRQGTEVMFATLSFSDSWMNHYRDALDRVPVDDLGISA